MDPSLYARFYSSGQMICPAGGLNLLPRHPQYKLRHQAPSSFTNPNRPEPCLIVQCNQPAVHHHSVDGVYTCTHIIIFSKIKF